MFKPVIAALIACTSIAVQAQDAYPNKPIRLVVPFAAGGPTDILGRLLAQDMSVRLGQPMIVDNRAGATGSIGQDLISKSAPDGYNIVMITSTSSNNYHLMNRTIDFTKDFSMIGQIYTTSTVLSINPEAPGMGNIHNLAQLVAHAKANPGALNFTSSGGGSLGHLTVEKVKSHFGISMEHINYKGQGPAMVDVLAGRVPIMAATFTTVPLIKSGKLRAIAIGTPKRSPVLPDTATFIEQGVPDLISAAWVGLAAAPGTPRAIIDRLTNELRTTLSKPDVAEKIHAAVGTAPEFLNSADLTAHATRDWQFWGKVIKDAGIKAN